MKCCFADKGIALGRRRAGWGAIRSKHALNLRRSIFEAAARAG